MRERYSSKCLHEKTRKPTTEGEIKYKEGTKKAIIKVRTELNEIENNSNSKKSMKKTLVPWEDWQNW